MKIEIKVNDIEKYENFSLRVVDEECKVDKTFDNIDHLLMTNLVKLFLMPRKQWYRWLEEEKNKKS